MLLDTAYSTMSEPVYLRQGTYRGTFLLRNLAPGTYKAVICRVGAKPVFDQRIMLQAGAKLERSWNLEVQAHVPLSVANLLQPLRVGDDVREHVAMDRRRRVNLIEDAVVPVQGACGQDGARGAAYR